MTDANPSEPADDGAGSPIIRHTERERSFEFAAGDSENIEAISEHIGKHIGAVKSVFHELVSDLVHIDIHMVAPSTARPFHTLVTSGMSDRAMTVAEGCDDPTFAELMLCLPPSWPLEHGNFKEERNYWPLRALKMLARMPHEYATWLAPGHTVPNGNPPKPFAENVGFTCALIARPLTTSDEFYDLPTTSGKIIHFYSVVPLYAEEMTLKLESGMEALFPGFDKHGVTEIVDIARPNIAAPAKPWWRKVF